MRRYYFLHTELMSPEAPAVIVAKVERLEQLKERKHELFEESLKLDEVIEAEEKELNSIKGVLFDYVDEKDVKQECPVEKVNILLKGVSNSKF